MEEEQAKSNHRNEEAGVLRGQGGENRGRGSSTKRSLAASPAAPAMTAEVRGGTPDPAAGGGNAAVAAAAAAAAGTGAVGAGDHCTSLSLDCGERETEMEQCKKLDCREKRKTLNPKFWFGIRKQRTDSAAREEGKETRNDSVLLKLKEFFSVLLNLCNKLIYVDRYNFLA